MEVDFGEDPRLALGGLNSGRWVVGKVTEVFFAALARPGLGNWGLQLTQTQPETRRSRPAQDRC